VDEDASGLTFEEWDPSADTDVSQVPVEMIVNSSELCDSDFDLREVIPIQLEEEARGVRCTRGAALKQIHGMDTKRYVLSVDNDNEFRSRCEWMCVFDKVWTSLLFLKNFGQTLDKLGQISGATMRASVFLMMWSKRTKQQKTLKERNPHRMTNKYVEAHESLYLFSIELIILYTVAFGFLSLKTDNMFSVGYIIISCLIWINKTRTKRRFIYEYLCDERLKTKNEESTRLGDTGLVVELEHLKAKTRLIDKKFASGRGECEI
jgi:hypothetical protein